MSLVDIIEKNNLDIATDKNTLHNYVKGFYEKYFEPYKDAEVNLVASDNVAAISNALDAVSLIE